MREPPLRSQSQRHLLNPHVLVVDHDPVSLADMRRVVEMAAPLARVRVETSGSAALGLLQSVPFHMVVTELNLPGVSGLALLSQVAKRDPHLIRIVHSSQIDTMGGDLIGKLAHALLYKPASTHQILSTLRKALAQLASANGTIDERYA